MALVHSHRYDINLGGLERAHPFDIHKYAKIRKQLIADGLASDGDFFVPDELTKEQILLVHTPAFLESLKNRYEIIVDELPEERLLDTKIEAAKDEAASADVAEQANS